MVEVVTEDTATFESRSRLKTRAFAAVERGDFSLVYHPLVSLGDGRILGAEALLRWQDADFGNVAPAELISLAEETGLIFRLGEWVLHEVCGTLRAWRSQYSHRIPVSVNMGGVQLCQAGCAEQLLAILQQHVVEPEELEVEITETSLIDTSSLARRNLALLRNAGVRIALDDFGIGFSSLSHLRDLPIHRLKIDRSFTIECMRDARTLTIVKGVIDMARSLGIAVAAEGVETQAQQQWMHHIGCDAAQGFLFCQPLSAEVFARQFFSADRGRGALSV